MKKFAILLISLMIIMTMIACTENSGGSDSTTSDNASVSGTDVSGTGASGTDAPATDAETTYAQHEPEGDLDEQPTLENQKTITLTPSGTHQEIESFGASGCWWAQLLGQRTDVSDEIAKLLFNSEEGIGLNSYRYNVGAGSADARSKSPLITDPSRRAYSFETAPGQYDWNRDKGAVAFMKKAVKYGVDELIFFANSPLERLTINGNAYGNTGYVTNIAPENYEAFAKYLLDVAEHFKSEGLPVRYVSPINEPAFEWAGGQEGCHYEDAEAIALLKVFVEEIQKRDGLKGVEISAPEGSSWRNSPNRWEDDTLGLCVKIMRDPVLGKYFKSLDAHSYWSTTDAKEHFSDVFYKLYPNIKLRQTEWCEMNGDADLEMEWGLSIANVIHEDMTILNCTSWSFWTACSFSTYGDGLLYLDQTRTKITTSKRFWSLGNYSRYLDRGYTRIDCSTNASSNVKASAYTGVNEYGDDEVVVVIVNNSTSETNFNFAGLDLSKYNRVSVNVTDKTRDLEETFYGEFKDGTAVNIPAQSVVTVVISNRTAA